MFAVRFCAAKACRNDFTSLKTVTFGDESAVRPDRAASVISILALFLIWGAFTGSKFVPLHVPGPFIGDTSFTYTATNARVVDEGKVSIIVHPFDDVKKAAESAGRGVSPGTTAPPSPPGVPCF
jgi:taurine transport system permease protein